ncbi:hypothetical protein I7I50_02231 [Histoplasma capsulatum G186AR]|uniref:Uncharacterized protein n=1 Tax=Ajellomyces capsulatus TaxID=5037 RepID=A0A8H7Z2Z6_AJECA|nr:hypothetical protein I7I52_01105 [Histoplasma capsulatum]QSS71409.1 hypothetical protein I7I50_02231 [Histoplasma capsulatum G186AR]
MVKANLHPSILRGLQQKRQSQKRRMKKQMLFIVSLKKKNRDKPLKSTHGLGLCRATKTPAFATLKPRPSLQIMHAAVLAPRLPKSNIAC